MLAAPWLGRGQAALAQDFECDPQAGPSGIKWCDIATGFGAPAQTGDRIRVHYDGRLADGTVFSSSYSPPAPLVLKLGAGEAPKGWELGILGGSGVPPMAPGTRRRLVLPPELARGSGITPPAGATVTYDITFLGKAS
ncbi:peptidyl-prolyl cis-trans isomerase chloroplastic [Chlorella sorokiniana]|uniref:peptidylprolyl isomerase n=1 Tax=Chlorella sorokiniana TaxID=3076 RepID=A0A2P6TJ47_CHLSO|nr:peptidyl-prolyl cis-trans isomerase chloroplastic [Chlorella sorokiniana]|eukprot:PRW39257.1 peptidyl-prolyl cis-trans isomerase chloroplastic [Chlorella sorokiniana]